VAPAREHPGQPQSSWTGELNTGVIGISGRGYAVVIWERLMSSGPHGLYVGLHHVS
jgi:hypothetical protein